MNVTELMRREWDARARKDAFHYIASWKKEWDVESFLASGEEDFQKLVKPVLDRCAIPAGGQAMLELGCGAGRMTGSFARRWGRTYAFDISPEMLGKARSIHFEALNIVWLLSNGADLNCVAAGAMDFVFSYLVLQHMPHEDLVKRYIAEMLRVLRPGGAVLFHYHGGFAVTMNWRGRVAWKVVDALWLSRLYGASRALAKAFGGDPQIAGKTWRGVSVSSERIAEYVRAAGGEVRGMTGQGTPMAWCCAVKGQETAERRC
ncbi:MAG TPA: class I SAM-dependent methyltransferase [Candidatus Angelobacter sp.]|nr:class I SAM-dependent methyltransferase [Candidatus Angelobacter sp.]